MILDYTLVIGTFCNYYKISKQYTIFLILVTRGDHPGAASPPAPQPQRFENTNPHLALRPHVYFSPQVTAQPTASLLFPPSHLTSALNESF